MSSAIARGTCVSRRIWWSSARPTVILDAIHTDDAERAAADWNALPTVPAVAHHRVIVFADRVVVTPGPRMGAVVKRDRAGLAPQPLTM